MAIRKGRVAWARGLDGPATTPDFFDKFPLFPFTIVGGVLVQLCAVRVKAESAINRRAVEGLGGLAMDGIVACAIGDAVARCGRNDRHDHVTFHPVLEEAAPR